MQLKTALLLILLSLSFSSCSLILSKTYGLRKIDQSDKKRYADFISKAKEQIDFMPIVSTKEQFEQIYKLGKNKNRRKNLAQPIQLIYFQQNELKSFHANCFAKGSLMSIDWNTDDRFADFLPKSAVHIDSFKLELADYHEILPEVNLNPNKEFIILVFWTSMLEKIAMDAIETVNDNIKNHGKIDEIDVYLINTDDFFAQYF